MDIVLERVLSLIPKKPNGEYVHGAKKDFCLSIGAPSNIISEWVRGVNKSYYNYLYVISHVYGVSVEWLKGETDIKEKAPAKDEGLTEDEAELLRLFRELNAEGQSAALAALGGIASTSIYKKCSADNMVSGA